MKIKHELKDRKDDLYETHPVAVRALLRVELLPDRVWEPACGRGNISEVLRRDMHIVYSTDLVDYGYAYADATGVDFLMETKNHDCDAIVTNPPFKLAADFVRKGLELCPKVVMLLRLQFIETNESRNDILDCGTLARIHVFRNRLPMMHREGWTGPKTTSNVAYAWFVWERNNKLPTILNRITWRN